jgi:WD40 repeat protein
MPDVFVSYSRRDADFVTRLAEALQARGKDVWIDVEGIRDAEVFPAALREAVERSDGFVFVISPDSVASRFCEQEVEHALELNKRVVPLILHKVPDEQLPEGIRVRNWIPVGEDGEFDTGVERLVHALDTDLDWAKEHTSWLLKALEWDGKGRDPSLLLRGSELSAAEQWLAGAAGKEPEPTALHTEYMLAGRMAATRRQRRLVGASLAIAALAIGLLVFALISRHSAVIAQATSKSRALAAQSLNQQNTDPELSILLARQAVKVKPTSDALFALRGAIDASPLRMRLPAAEPQSCTPPVGGPGLAYAPNGTVLAEALCGGTVRLFDARTARPLRQLSVPGGTGAIAYSPDDSRLAVGTEHGVQLLDAAGGGAPTQLPGGAAVNSLAFSPDGSLLAATTQDASMNSTLTLWHVSGGTPRTIASGPLNPLFGVTALRHVVFTVDGRSLIVGGAPGVRVYDVASGRLERTLPGTQVADDVSLSADGQHLAVSVLAYNESQISVTPLPVASSTSNPDTVKLWSVRGWRPEGTLASFIGVEQPTIAFSPDGASVAIGGADGKAGLWATRTREQIVSFPGPKAAIDAIGFTPDGKLVATGVSDGTAQVWRAGGFELKDLDTRDLVTQGGWGRDRFVIVDAMGARIWEWPSVRELQPLHLLTPGAPPGSEGGSSSLDGALIAWHTPTATQIWSTRQRRIVGSLPVGTAYAIAFSRDGRHVGYFDPASPMEIVDLASGRKLALQGSPPACSVGWRWAQFSPDDRFLAATTLCGQTAVWDAHDARRISQFNVPVQVGLTAFSPDDVHVALGLNDGTIAIWDLRRRREVHLLTGHASAIGTIFYNPDGRMLISTSFDGTARIWDTATGRTLRIFPHSLGGGGFSPDGKLVGIADQFGVVRFWDGCADCTNAKGLLSIASQRVTRQLTPQERATFLGG